MKPPRSRRKQSATVPPTCAICGALVISRTLAGIDLAAKQAVFHHRARTPSPGPAATITIRLIVAAKFAPFGDLAGQNVGDLRQGQRRDRVRRMHHERDPRLADLVRHQLGQDQGRRVSWRWLPPPPPRAGRRSSTCRFCPRPGPP